MHKDPARRYRSVEALIRDIDHFLAGEPLEARPDSSRYRLGKFGRRNWRPLAATGVTLVLLIGLVVFYTVRLARRATRRCRSRRAPSGSSTSCWPLRRRRGRRRPADTLRVVTLVDRGRRQAQALEGDTGAAGGAVRGPSAASTSSSAG